MVHNPIYEGDGPVYESVLTQHEMNNVHDMNRPRSVVTPGGQHDNFPQSLSDSARYVDRPVHLQYLYSNTTSDTSDTGTPIDTPTSESIPLTAPRVMALKKNGQERNKLHLTLSLGDNNEPSNISSSEMDPNTRTINPADVDEHYIAMSPAGVPSHSMNIK